MYINFLSVQNNFSTGGIYMEHNKENENKSIEEIKEMGAVLPEHKKEDSNIQVLTIIGQIEGHSVNRHKLKQLSMSI